MKLRGAFQLPRHHVDIEIAEGSLVTEAAEQAGIVLNTSCARRGSCGGCAVDLIEGTFQNDSDVFEVTPAAPERVLGCQTRIVAGHWKIAIPRRSLVEAGEKIVSDYRILRVMGRSPSVRKVYLEMSPPTLEDPIGGLERLRRALRNGLSTDLSTRPTVAVLRKLPGVLATGAYRVTVTLALNHGLWDLIDIEPGDTSAGLYGMAVDIGTTTVVCALVDAHAGNVLRTASCYNQQVQKADDVASRIVHAQQPGGLEELRHLVVVDTVNRLTRLLCNEQGIALEQVSRMVISCNTIMAHLFLGIDPASIGGIPFHPAAAHPGSFRAAALGVGINPAGLVDVVPAISGYVGGDITSDIYVSSLDTVSKPALLVDLGTNGEIAVCHEGRILASATAAGPAFEGGRLRHGMRASTGAIEHVRIDPATYVAHCDVIGDVPPIGICGSGLIDLIAEMRHVGLMDSAGRFDRSLVGKTDRLRPGTGNSGGMLQYVVVPSEQTEDQHDAIVIDEQDVSTLLQAKAATYAGISILLRQAGLGPDDLGAVFLAGGFARHIDLTNAIRMGLLPDVPLDRYEVMGNGSLAGAIVGLIDHGAWDQFSRIAAMPRIVELNRVPEFQDEYVSAMFLPHLEPDRFPSVSHSG